MEKLYQIREMAEILGLATETVYRKVKSGEIPVIRIGGRIRVPESLLEEWLDQKRREPADRWTNYLHRFVSLLKDRWGPQFQSLVLFGSRATRKERRESDIDVLIIKSAFSKSRLERQEMIFKLAQTISSPFAHRLSPVPLTPLEAEEFRPLYLGLLEGHVVLWDVNNLFRRVMDRFHEHLDAVGAVRKLTPEGLPYWIFPQEAA